MKTELISGATFCYDSDYNEVSFLDLENNNTYLIFDLRKGIPFNWRRVRYLGKQEPDRCNGYNIVLTVADITIQYDNLGTITTLHDIIALDSSDDCYKSNDEILTEMSVF